MTLDGVIGHGAVQALLQGDLRHPSHAYLFVGPGNVGKSTVARRFAASLVAGEDDRARERAQRGVHPDVVLVEPDGRTALTVDRAREAAAQSSLVPVEGIRKVFLMEEAGLMNDEAANALLKTLEEPGPTTVFVLCVESLDDLPETVASRCHIIQFGRVPDDELRSALIDRGIEPAQAEALVAAAAGRPGLALDLATRPEVAGFRKWWLEVPQRLGAHTAQAHILAEEAVAAAEPLLAGLQSQQRAELEAAGGSAPTALRDRHERDLRRTTQALHMSGLEILANFYRDVAAAQFGGPVRNRDIPPSALTLTGPTTALRRAERVLEAVGALRDHQRPRLAFAALFDDLAARV